MRHVLIPGLMGIAMGLMGLWMLHGVLLDQDPVHGIWAAVVLHVVAVFALAALAARVPAVRAHVAGMTRHMGIMLIAAFATGAIVHLLHGGPAPWI